MDRRNFIRQSAILAVGLSAFGKIGFSNGRYIADSPTTTDILGPFYRPGSPLRADINPSGYSGKLLHFYGIIFRSDGTPYENCSIEIWQCDENRKYDNTSDEFRYRGRQITKADGKYKFITAIPVPYPAGESGDVWRPAHIHMVVKGEGQQDLITQVYFTNDPYLETDASSSSPQAKSRILSIERKSENEDELRFDIFLQKEFKLDDVAMKRLSGIYAMSDKTLMEFYQVGDLLYLKWNGQIRESLRYRGNNEFESGGHSRTTARFEMQPSGDFHVAVNFFRLVDRADIPLHGVKRFNY
jgi:protocatechuate 3,4-dioxygenase beta subunit